MKSNTTTQATSPSNPPSRPYEEWRDGPPPAIVEATDEIPFSRFQPDNLRWNFLNLTPTIRRCITLLFFGLVNWLLLAPAGTFRDIHVFLSQQDKLAHFLIFAILSWLLRWSIPSLWAKGRLQYLVILALISYGTAAESIQPLLAKAGRTFEWGDLLMNGTGIAVGLRLFAVMVYKVPAGGHCLKSKGYRSITAANRIPNHVSNSSSR